MTFDTGYSEEELRDMSQKEFRKEFPSGWMELARYETLVLIIDALIESPATREYNLSELSEFAGPVPESIEDHIGSLVQLGLVDELDGRSPTRYSLNEKNPITQRLFDLNLTVEMVKAGELPKTLNRDQLSELDRGSLDSSNSNTFDGIDSGSQIMVEPESIAPAD